jgi:hypothetical protein
MTTVVKTFDQELEDLFDMFKEEREFAPVWTNPITEDFIYELVEAHLEKFLEVLSWEKLTQNMINGFLKLNLEVLETSKEGSAEGFYNWKEHKVVLHADVIANTAKEHNLNIKSLAEDVLLHELRHVWQFMGGFDAETVNADFRNPDAQSRKIEIDAIKFARSFRAAYAIHR